MVDDSFLLLESGDFLLLESGDKIILEVAAEGGGAGPAGSSTAIGAKSLAQQQQQQQRNLIPKRRRVLNAELHVTAKGVTVPLELPFRVKSTLLSYHGIKSSLEVYSHLVQTSKASIRINAAPYVPNGIRLQMEGKCVQPLSVSVDIQGTKYSQTNDIINELYIEILKEKAKRKFYDNNDE